MPQVDFRRLPDLKPLLERARPLAARARATGEKLEPHLKRLDGELRKHPALAKAVDATAAFWRQLVDAFCDMIDPALAGLFPDRRLAGALTASGDIDLRGIGKEGIENLGLLSSMDPERQAALRQMKWSAIELQLRKDQVLQRTLSLPGASRDFLGPIIEHRLERLTPWRLDKVLYGYRVLDTAVTPGGVDVALVATSKDIVELAARDLRDAGLAPTRIGTADADSTKPIDINLLQGGAKAPQKQSRKLVSRVALAVIAALVVADLVTGSIASGAADQQDAVATKLVKARRLLKSATMANIGGRERALIEAKDPDKAMVVLIDRLAAAIPQNTYLKEVAATTDTVRLVGSSTNAPALVGELEVAGLTNVRFSAAITREKDGRDNFEITANRGSTATTAAEAPRP